MVYVPFLVSIIHLVVSLNKDSLDYSLCTTFINVEVSKEAVVLAGLNQIYLKDLD